jgi:molecular chaperone HscA
MLLESITHAKNDMTTRVLVEAKTEAEQILVTTEKFLIKNSSLISPSEMTATTQSIHSLQQALTTEDKDLIHAKIEELNEVTRPFAERVMDEAVSNAMKGQKI